MHIKTADTEQHKTFTQIKHRPGYKASVNKFEKNEIMQNLFSAQSRITQKLFRKGNWEISKYLEIKQSTSNNWRAKRKSQWKLKKDLELNDYKNRHKKLVGYRQSEA